MEAKNILREERKKRDFTQDDIAKILNLSRSAYAKYETGDAIPTTESLIKLSKHYNLSIDYLLGLKQ